MISACSFVDQLRGLGYSQYAGVPCSFLTSLINYVSGDPALDYIGATSEGEAVGITFGAFLAGRKTVTMCQNSGLGNMVNPLTSLNYPFRVPTLLVVTWRGQPEVKDEPQHEQMGRILHRLLETLEIPCLPFPRSEADIAQTMAQAAPCNDQQRRDTKRVVEQGERVHHVTEAGVLAHGHRFPPGQKRSEGNPNCLAFARGADVIQRGITAHVVDQRGQKGTRHPGIL